MKSLVLSLFAVLLAVGLSSYTIKVKEAEKEVLRQSYVFYQNSLGSYSLTPTRETCQQQSNPCTKTYTSNPGVTSFTLATEPSGAINSSQQGLQ